jgi:hypothetical protein
MTDIGIRIQQIADWLAPESPVDRGISINKRRDAFLTALQADPDIWRAGQTMRKYWVTAKSGVVSAQRTAKLVSM